MYTSKPECYLWILKMEISEIAFTSRPLPLGMNTAFHAFTPPGTDI